jgi:hypothetical protein
MALAPGARISARTALHNAPRPHAKIPADLSGRRDFSAQKKEAIL